MNPVKSLSIVLAFIVGIFALMSIFVVDETERAIILRLGKIQADSKGTINVLEPGLHFKVPFIDTARFFDKRIQTLDIQKSRIPTEEKKELIIDLFNKWRVKDFAKFFKATGGLRVRAEQLLREKTNDGLRAEIGQRRLNDVVSVGRDLIMEKISKDVNIAAETLGIEVLDARIVAIDLPREVQDSVFGLMRTERKRIAGEHRAMGRSRAEAIQANADARVTVLLAEADQTSKVLRGEGDAEAAHIFEISYSKDPEFFRFYRSLEAYRRTFQNQNDVIVMKPDSDFFKYFGKIQGKGTKKEG